MGCSAIIKSVAIVFTTILNTNLALL